MLRMKRMFWIVIVTLAGFYLAACAALFVFQARLVYFPGPATADEPKDHGLVAQELFLKSADGVKIFTWYVAAERPRGVAIVCHGNAGTLVERAEYARALREFGLSTLLFDYRGYGRSEGTPSEEGTYLDAEECYRHVTHVFGFQPGQIFVVGESLGGGVATELALRKTIGGLILQDTFTSIPDMGAAQYPWLPVRLLARVRYDNLAKIASVPVPLLLFHSKDDEIVPYAHGEKLYAAALPPKHFVTTSGGHNEAFFYTRPEWNDEVRQFIDRTLTRRASR